MPESSILIIALSNHPNLGPLLIPYFARTLSSGALEVEEQATHIREKDGMSAEELKIVSLAQSYSEKQLMVVYSRERLITEFLRKLPDKLLKEVVRPFIDKKIREMIGLIRLSGLPVYTKDAGVKLLYEHNRVLIPAEDAEASFLFEINPIHFRYLAECRMNDKFISLQKKKPVMVLSSVPAILLLGNEFLIFKRIDAPRLTPFLEKKYVEVPVSESFRYMEKIVLPAIARYPARTAGIETVCSALKCVAELSVERSMDEQPVLQLRFRYGTHYFVPGQKSLRIYPRLEDREGSPVIRYFARRLSQEQNRIEMLNKWGFRQISETLFSFQDNSIKYGLVDWMKSHREELLHHYTIVNTETSLRFCLEKAILIQDITSAPDWFDIRIVIEIGSFRFPFIYFKKHILEGRREFILPDDTIALLPTEWFDKYSDLFMLGNEQKDSIRIRKMHFGVVVALEEESNVPKEYIQKGLTPVPPRIKAILRPYQQEGFSWLVHLAGNGFGGCLADDMGLGKTLQTIALLQHLYDPTEPEKIELKPHTAQSFCPNEQGQYFLFGDDWEDGFPAVDSKPAIKDRPVDFSASLIVVPTSLLPNWKREIRRFSSLRVYEYSGDHRGKEPWKKFERYPVVLVTYGVLRRDIELLDNYPFKCIILDESQNIKNPDSITYRSVMRLKGDHRFVLTGTPIENSLKDLWAQFNFINPGLLGSAEGFRNHFIVPVTKEGNETLRQRLQQIIRPFFLRRTKQQVAPELPPLTEEVIYCEMSIEQQELYRKEKNILRNTLIQEWGKNTFIALSGITRLRQLANHPRMVLPEYTGSSGKMEQIVETYETIVSEGHKVLIFSSFVTHLQLLAETFRERNWQYAMLTGSTTDREGEIARFSLGKEVSAFLISLKAGGVGLNLTDADYVFIIDPWWNPAAEMQAESRAHRIGQDKQVIVYRFITSETIEEKIRILQESKSELAGTFITENDPLKQLTDKEWQELL